VVAICGADPFFLLWLTKPALLAHDAVNFFVIDHPSYRVLIVSFLTLMFFLIAQTLSFAAKKDKKKTM
jgi:hypothetical protein